ncbi:MAG: protein kinase domain-containing protein [Phycisphaerales bacterium]
MDPSDRDSEAEPARDERPHSGPPKDGIPPECHPPDDDIGRLFALSHEDWIARLREAHQRPDLGSIGPYRLISEVGRGGQGEVYKAIQPGTGRPIAIKRIARLGLAPDGPTIARFMREVAALTRLDHPSVVRVHALEIIDGHSLLVMEYVDGHPIHTWADAQWASVPRPRALAVVLATFAAACEGVAHAHRRGVIHLDLKPDNVLVTPRHTPKILDFGIARVLSERESGTLAAVGVTRFAGTPTYASPEQLASDSATVDTRSDVYALGLLLFRMLSGVETIDPALSLDRLLPWIRSHSPPRIHHTRPGLPAECDWIVRKAAHPDPGQRYQSADALVEDVRRVLSGHAVSAHPPSMVYFARKFASRHRVGVGAAALVLAAILGATAFSVSWARHADAALERESAALEASREAERSARLNAQRQQNLAILLRSVLGASGEVGGGRPDITVREALDHAVARYLGSATSRNGALDPLVEAPLRLAVGETYLSIGRFAEAADHLRLAAAIYGEHADAEQFLHRSSLYLLGRAMRETPGGLAESEAVLRHVIALYRQERHAWRMPLAEALTSLGVTLRRLNRQDDAAACYREAADLYAETQGPESPNVASTTQNLAILDSRIGRHEEAEAAMRRVLRIREATEPGATPNHARTLGVLANVLWAAGKASEGEASFRQAIAMERDMAPVPDHRVAQVLSELIDWLERDGRFREAIEPALEVQRIHAQFAGPTHARSLAARTRLASLLRRDGRAAKSESLCGEITRGDLPPIPQSADLLCEWAEALASLGRDADADAALERAWHLLPTITPPDADARQRLATRALELWTAREAHGLANRWRDRARAQ